MWIFFANYRLKNALHLSYSFLNKVCFVTYLTKKPHRSRVKVYLWSRIRSFVFRFWKFVSRISRMYEGHQNLDECQEIKTQWVQNWILRCRLPLLWKTPSWNHSDNWKLSHQTVSIISQSRCLLLPKHDHGINLPSSEHLAYS